MNTTTNDKTCDHCGVAFRSGAADRGIYNDTCNCCHYLIETAKWGDTFGSDSAKRNAKAELRERVARKA